MMRLDPSDLKGRLPAAFADAAENAFLRPERFCAHRLAFEYLTDPGYSGNFALMPCLVDGVATSAIVLMVEEPDGKVLGTPVFIAPTDRMNLVQGFRVVRMNAEAPL